MSDVPVLFRRLVDDAALFPPGNAPMATAVPGHLALRDGPHRHLVGPFLCPARRLGELRGLLGEATLEVGVIVDTGLAGVARAIEEVVGDDRLTLAMVEVPVPTGGDLVAGALAAMAPAGPGQRAFVELPRSDGWRAALDAVAGAGQGAKLRTGGLRAELFPTDAELAAFIAACAERAVPFKCTAGLHHAVRHVDPGTGFHHHGFLNIVVATARAVAGAEVEPAVAEADPAALAAEAAALPEEMARRARELFVGFGSCSIDEPLGDLRQLGLLP